SSNAWAVAIDANSPAMAIVIDWRKCMAVFPATTLRACAAVILGRNATPFRRASGRGPIAGGPLAGAQLFLAPTEGRCRSLQPSRNAALSAGTWSTVRRSDFVAVLARSPLA